MAAQQQKDVKMPLVFDRDAVLTIEQVAAGLGVGVETVQKMDLPFTILGYRTLRIRWGRVLDILDKKGMAA